MNIGSMMASLVPITNFNKGQASKIFDRLKTEKFLIVLKNNRPSAVILSPEEYERITEIEENYALLTMAEKRLSGNALERAVPAEEAYRLLGITEEELAGAEEPEIE